MSNEMMLSLTTIVDWHLGISAPELHFTLELSALESPSPFDLEPDNFNLELKLFFRGAAILEATKNSSDKVWPAKKQKTVL